MTEQAHSISKRETPVATADRRRDGEVGLFGDIEGTSVAIDQTLVTKWAKRNDDALAVNLAKVLPSSQPERRNR